MISIMKLMTTLMIMQHFKRYWNQQHQLEKLPTKRLVSILRKHKLSSNWTITTVRAHYHQPCLSDLRCFYRIKNDRIEMRRSSHINGLDLTTSNQSLKLGFVFVSMQKMLPIQIQCKSVETILFYS